MTLGFIVPVLVVAFLHAALFVTGDVLKTKAQHVNDEFNAAVNVDIEKGSTRAAPERPNVIFILADDVGYGDLGCYGHPYARTPYLDQLASEGTLFREFHVSGATCNPSRTGFMTSRNPASLPNLSAFHGFKGLITITELLKNAGYATAHFGKWHIGPDSSDGMYGIDKVEIADGRDGIEGRDSRKFDEAVKFIEAHYQNSSFYVHIWGRITHHPVTPPQWMVDEFANVTVNKDDFGKHMQDKIDILISNGEDPEKLMREYLADLWSLDRMVGQLLTRLDELNLRHNTIVVFSSDQGPAHVHMGSTGELRGGKHGFWEGGVRVPFIVRWPGQVPAGKINHCSLISALDWLPTICDAAGIPIDNTMFEGESTLDIWNGNDRSRVNPLFWKGSNVKGHKAMRYDKWKFYSQGPTSMLFDLDTDVGENADRVNDELGVAEVLLGQLELWDATLPKEYALENDTELPFNPNERPVVIAPLVLDSSDLSKCIVDTAMSPSVSSLSPPSAADGASAWEMITTLAVVLITIFTTT